MVIFPPPGESNTVELENAIVNRQTAKLERNFALADQIRDKLLADGIILRDAPDGVHWSRVHTQERGGVPDDWKAKFVPLYKKFCVDANNPKFDWSEEALLIAYRYETRGEGEMAADIFVEKTNGYAAGKKWMDLAITSWREDIAAGMLTKQELYDDMPELKDWLARILDTAVLDEDGLALRNRMARVIVKESETKA